jgi:hypothetical protein
LTRLLLDEARRELETAIELDDRATEDVRLDEIRLDDETELDETGLDETGTELEAPTAGRLLEARILIALDDSRARDEAITTLEKCETSGSELVVWELAAKELRPCA